MFNTPPSTSLDHLYRYCNVSNKPWVKKIRDRLSLGCIATGLLFLALVGQSLFATSTRPLFFDKKAFSQGKLEKTFIDEQGMIRLNLGYSLVAETGATVVWDIAVNEKEIVVATGSKGEVFIFDRENPKKEVNRFSTEAAGIFSIAKGSEGTLYFGSATQGIVYELSPQRKQLSVLAALGENYVWDLEYDEVGNRLLAAVGGKNAALYEVALAQEQAKPKLLAQFPQFNATKVALHNGNIYVATSKRGKLYELDRSAQQKKVIYDSRGRDISDFVFIDNEVIVSTAGEQTASDGVNGVDAADIGPPEIGNFVDARENGKSNKTAKAASMKKRQGGPKFTNSVVAVDLSTLAQRTLLQAQEKSIVSIGEMASGELLVAFLEHGEIVKLDLSNLQTQRLHYDKQVMLSTVVFAQDEFYFASAKNGDIYGMGVSLPESGTFTSKVKFLKDVTAFGNMAIENYGKGNDVSISIRTGVNEEVDKQWSDWQPFVQSSDQELYSLQESLPIAGFVQFRIELKPSLVKSKQVSPEIAALLFFYGVENTPPLVKNVDVVSRFQQKNGPPLSYSTKNSFSAKLGVIEKLKGAPQPSHYELVWDVENNENDLLEYDVYYQRRGTEKWQLLVENHYGQSVSFDNGLFIDGVYRFKIKYHDYLTSGKQKGFLREALSPYHLVDNTPPAVEFTKVENGNLRIVVKDRFSPITSLFYSWDGENYFSLLPEDGLFDNMQESFVLPVEASLGDPNSSVSVIVREISNNFTSKNFRID